MTHSTAIFSDAAESVVHVIAVGFAWFSLRLSTRSASAEFLTGTNGSLSSPLDLKAQ
jgi:divalent metal cation (Fe/Co/Zn/Cd) transporter